MKNKELQWDKIYLSNSKKLSGKYFIKRYNKRHIVASLNDIDSCDAYWENVRRRFVSEVVISQTSAMLYLFKKAPKLCFLIIKECKSEKVIDSKTCATILKNIYAADSSYCDKSLFQKGNIGFFIKMLKTCSFVEISNAEEIALYETLPETISIYRGAAGRDVVSILKGVSWTLTRNVAEAFSLQYKNWYKVDSRFIIEAKIKRENVLSIILNRNENEIIATSSSIFDHKIDEFS